MLELQLIDVDDRIERHWLMDWIKGVGAADWPIRVIIADGARKREVYMENYDGEYPGDMAFRAYIDRNPKTNLLTICIFMDRAETPNSILWLLMHEFAHYNIRHTDMSPLGYFFALKRDEWLKGLGITPQEYVDSVHLRNRDDLHEAEPEEVTVNNVATTIVGECYDRAWWRRQWAKIEEAA